MKKVIFALFAIGILINLGYITNPFEDEPEFIASYGDSVVLYSTSWCGYCEKTRQELAKHGIEYIEHDIETSSVGREQYDALNGSGIPLLILGGKVIRGYDSASIKAWAGR